MSVQMSNMRRPRGVVYDEDELVDGSNVHNVPVRHHRHESRVARTDTEINNIHLQLQRLFEDEKMLLRTKGISARDKANIKESFFHQQMELMLRLPQSEQDEYRPQTRVIQRMGTTRHNLYNDAQEEYTPYFCVAVIIVNVCTFVYSMGLNDWKFQSLEDNPMIGPSRDVLIDMGAKETSKIRNGGEYWRLVVPLFLHAGIIHLVMNMLVLTRLGFSMENSFGWKRVAAVYLLSGTFGNLCSAIFLTNVIGVGASSALFGLIGALFGDFIQNYKSITEGKCSYFIQLLISSVVGLAIGIFPLIDNFGHFGGWIYGIVAGLTFLAGAVKDSTGHAVTVWYNTPLVLIGGLAQVAAFVAGYTLLFDAVEPGWCGFCQSINCVETRYWNCDLVNCNIFANGTITGVGCG